MRKFIIKNTDSYGEKSFEIVRGSVREEAEQTIYEYESKLGKCQLTISDRRVIISREGEISAIIDVDLDKKTEFVYVTKEMTMPLPCTCLNSSASLRARARLSRWST